MLRRLFTVLSALSLLLCVALSSAPCAVERVGAGLLRQTRSNLATRIVTTLVGGTRR
jgi:hypothetical protein